MSPALLDYERIHVMSAHTASTVSNSLTMTTNIPVCSGYVLIVSALSMHMYTAPVRNTPPAPK